LMDLEPGLPQFASFDTAFHATNPEVARRYAVPDEVVAQGIRRHGFHGISYAAIVRKVKEMQPVSLPKRLLALHLGNGASLCAIREGVSVATTMGYSPLDGLTMGTRSGAIDGNAVLRMAELYGIEGAARILNKESGLLALGGSNDMRQTGAFAREHFIYWTVRHAGSMIAAMGGLDAMAFTGGIGENDAGVRDAIVGGLTWAGKVPVWVIPAEEERQIATEAMTLMQG
jgi:acetate kinase